MNLEAVGVGKPFAALSTLVWLLPTVDPHVGLEAIGLREGRSALLTLEGPVAGVLPHVNRQLPRLRERRLTLCALERPLPRMLLLVSDETVEAAKVSTALLADEWPVARVNAHVHFEAVRAGVLGEADATLVGFFPSVLAPVLLESIGDGKAAAAVLTHIWLVTGVGSTVNYQAACNTDRRPDSEMWKKLFTEVY